MNAFLMYQKAFNYRTKTLKRLFNFSFFFIAITLSACQNLFDFSPYEIRIVDGDKNTTLKNLVDIENTYFEADSITFAVITDSHYEYNKLKSCIESINNNYSVDFVVCLGDFADSGLQTEYELFHQEMSKLVVPYLTVIGNHDYRSNGGDIYSQMFGQFNYSFKTGFIRFIAFDDIFWESNKTPDFDWLQMELQKTFEPVKIILTHIPIDSDQFDEASRTRFYDLNKDYQVDYGIHGHTHKFALSEKDGTTYLISGAVMKGFYSLVTVFSDGSANIQEVSF